MRNSDGSRGFTSGPSQTDDVQSGRTVPDAHFVRATSGNLTAHDELPVNTVHCKQMLVTVERDNG